jgi:hypothetical protein
MLSKGRSVLLLLAGLATLLLTACPQGQARQTAEAATAGSEPEVQVKNTGAAADSKLPADSPLEPAMDETELQVPDWLLAAPTIHALFPGNGDVVTLGQLDSLARSAANNPVEEAEFGRWYIYSAEGELINGLPDGIHWWEHYDTQWTARTRAYVEEQIYSSEYAGYTIYYRGEFETVEVYDYDGTLMPADFDPFTADKERMHDMTGAEIMELATQSAVKVPEAGQ